MRSTRILSSRDEQRNEALDVAFLHPNFMVDGDNIPAWWNYSASCFLPGWVTINEIGGTRRSRNPESSSRILTLFLPNLY